MHADRKLFNRGQQVHRTRLNVSDRTPTRPWRQLRSPTLSLARKPIILAMQLRQEELVLVQLIPNDSIS